MSYGSTGFCFTRSGHKGEYTMTQHDTNTREVRLMPYRPPEKPEETPEKRLARLIFLWADENNLWEQVKEAAR